MDTINFLDVKSAERYAQMLKAVGHPIRLRIVDILSHGERSVGEMEDLCQAKQAIISQQLKTLRLTGLVAFERRNGRTYYRLLETNLKELLVCLRKCRC